MMATLRSLFPIPFILMMSFKHLLCLIFIGFGVFAFGESTTITGHAIEWRGKEIRLKIFSDHITNKQYTAASTTIDSLGYFELETEIDKTLEAWIVVNRFSAPIFLEPGKHYNITLVDSPKNVLVDTWQRGSFAFEFIELSEHDLNAEVAAFEQAYYSFYVDNALLIGTNKLKTNIDSFASNYDSALGESFLGDYQNYAIAEMKLSAGFKKIELFEKYIQNVELQPEDANWYYFFDIFFDNYFVTYDAVHGGATIYNRLTQGLTPFGLDSLLRKDDFLEQQSLRQMVLLKAIAEVTSNKKFKTVDLVDNVNYVLSQSNSDAVTVVATNLLAKLTNDPASHPFYEITKNWTPTLSPPKEERYTLVMIGNSTSDESQKESLVIAHLLIKYPNLFVVEELDVSNNTENASILWTRHHSAEASEILEKLKIYGLPHFMWLNLKGEIEVFDLEKPSMGLEKRIYKIESDKKEEQKIKIGSK